MEEKRTETLFERIEKGNQTIHIARVPQATKAKFIDLANEQFCGDYGMCLKFLCDGLINPDINIVYAQLEDLNSRVVYLENNQSKIEEKKQVKALNGRVIKNG